MEETNNEGIVMEIPEEMRPKQDVPVEPEKVKTEEELAAEEGELDISNPDATPHKYNIFSSETHIKLNLVVEQIMSEHVNKSELPLAFVEILPQVLAGKIKVLTGKIKDNEKLNRLTNRLKLTPVKDLELYETIEESRAPIEDLDSEAIV